ncbi:protein YgfX [Candidatus Williamhamiltonella defendens]|uniref:protein YgfX n=1 Tax=Candidatus Williamhamiltonella defendens TaxID=138072 RepID=UPI0013DF467A|nr:protein YgfX [Candidatus Hamiltonella defensa]
MGQFQCKLQVSPFTKLFSSIVYTLLALITLLAPSGPKDFIPFYLNIIIFLVFECVLSQKKIRSYQGKIIFMADNRLHWLEQNWLLIKKPWALSRYGLLLFLKQEDTNAQKNLWLLYDNMSEPEWRQLHQFVFLFDARSSCLSI